MHIYHNQLSFFLEELQVLTHYGQIAWEEGQGGRLKTVLPASSLEISLDRLGIFIKDEDANIISFPSDPEEFAELYKSAVASVIIAKHAMLKTAIEEVTNMYKSVPTGK